MKFKKEDRVILKTNSEYYNQNFNNPPRQHPKYGIVKRISERIIDVDWFNKDEVYLYMNVYNEKDLDFFNETSNKSLVSSIDNLLDIINQK